MGDALKWSQELSTIMKRLKAMSQTQMLISKNQKSLSKRSVHRTVKHTRPTGPKDQLRSN